MIAKCKNPYYDNKIDKKFVFLLAVALNGIDILIGCKDVGLYKKDNLIGILNTDDDYLASDIIELSVYEVFTECIPDGMRYNKELDKLVPDIINVEFERVKFDDFSDKYEQINKRKNGFIKADLNKIDFTLVDPFAYKDLGKQLTIGAEKYERDNWQKGDILTYLAALQRHLNDVEIALIENDFEKLIDDTGVNQGAALMFNSMAVHYFIRKILKDKNVK